MARLAGHAWQDGQLCRMEETTAKAYLQTIQGLRALENM